MLNFGKGKENDSAKDQPFTHEQVWRNLHPAVLGDTSKQMPDQIVSEVPLKDWTLWGRSKHTRGQRFLSFGLAGMNLAQQILQTSSLMKRNQSSLWHPELIKYCKCWTPLKFQTCPCPLLSAVYEHSFKWVFHTPAWGMAILPTNTHICSGAQGPMHEPANLAVTIADTLQKHSVLLSQSSNSEQQQQQGTSSGRNNNA